MQPITTETVSDIFSLLTAPALARELMSANVRGWGSLYEECEEGLIQEGFEQCVKDGYFVIIEEVLASHPEILIALAKLYRFKLSGDLSLDQSLREHFESRVQAICDVSLERGESLRLRIGLKILDYLNLVESSDEPFWELVERVLSRELGIDN
ncbi:MAG: hypothetical protein KDD53_00185 [Bdellovibrionales bacterium]|nr:hypothetical protein [Bdellovibrionales bacterium]